MKVDWVLASDIDNTLTGNQPALNKLSKTLTKLQNENKLALFLSTGRKLSEIIDGFENENIPKPKAIISQVGTEIYLPPFGYDEKPLADWDEYLHEDFSRDEAEEFLEDVEGVEMQPEKYNTPLKVSVFLHNAENPEESVRQIRRNIGDKSDIYQVVWSSGKHLDIIPTRGGKGHAIQFLLKHLDIKTDNMLVAGDSGNDSSMFDKFENGIAVANAKSELKKFIKENPKNHYLAEKEYAEGVREGLVHFGVLEK